MRTSAQLSPTLGLDAKAHLDASRYHGTYTFPNGDGTSYLNADVAESWWTGAEVRLPKVLS